MGFSGGHLDYKERVKICKRTGLRTHLCCILRSKVNQEANPYTRDGEEDRGVKESGKMAE